ncbi:MAG: SLC13 family permease [Phycisphaerales bacterium]|nr:SLC13 family permease [Phycisphaerales bacterium]
MTWEAWLVGMLILGMLGALATGRFGADIVLMGVLVALLVAGVLDAKEAVSGFANPGVITVAMLYVVAAGLKETGGLSMLATPFLGRPKSDLAAQARVVFPVAVLSAFLNNTPIVAMFIPMLSEWSRRNRLALSRLLLPLSYATILGGCCTLIGTSTNLVVKSLVDDYAASHPGSPDVPQISHFSMFTIAPVGVPVALAGLAYLLLMGRRLLRSGGGALVGERAREYDVEMIVDANSPMVGRTVEQAGLRHLPGLFLSRIERAEETIIAVGPEQTLRADDTLVFVGLMDSVKDLQKFRGLKPSGVKKDAARPFNRMIEVVISSASPLVGQSIRGGQFRTRYGAVVIAVHRYGERLRGKIGDVVLRPGDTLLLEAPTGWSRSHRDAPDFSVVNEHSEAAAPRHERAWLSIGILLLIVLGLSFAGKLGVSEMTVAMAGAAAMIAMRCCTGPQARASVDWQVLIVIGAAFGLGRAMEKTGLASMLAELTLGAVSGAGPIAMMAALYALTLVCTIFITNNAAAVLAFPIAANAAQQAGMTDLTPFAIVIALAASLEFATPLGYQTNLMVMGPGGYRFMDYVRLGGPLTILCGVVAIAVLAVNM